MTQQNRPGRVQFETIRSKWQLPKLQFIERSFMETNTYTHFKSLTDLKKLLEYLTYTIKDLWWSSLVIKV